MASKQAVDCASRSMPQELRCRSRRYDAPRNASAQRGRADITVVRPCHAALSDRLKISQPLPSVFPALDLADLDEPLDASVLPAFERAPLLGFPPLLAILFHLLPSNAGLPESTDTEQPSAGQLGASGG